MAKLTGAAWAAHNLGLAACFGGQLFGKLALNANLDVLDDEADRGKLLNTAWNRYNAVNAASFATAAATWFPGRLGLSGQEIDQQTRNLVLAKDALFAVGGLLGLASMIQGKSLAGQAPGGAVPIASGTTPSSRTPDKAATLLRSVNLLGDANIAVVGAIIGVTSLLAMKSSESTRFGGISKLLP